MVTETEAMSPRIGDCQRLPLANLAEIDTRRPQLASIQSLLHLGLRDTWELHSWVETTQPPPIPAALLSRGTTRQMIDPQARRMITPGRGRRPAKSLELRSLKSQIEAVRMVLRPALLIRRDAIRTTTCPSTATGPSCAHPLLRATAPVRRGLYRGLRLLQIPSPDPSPLAVHDRAQALAPHRT